MNHLRRASAFNLKSLTPEGIITGYASVFDIVDAQDEQVAPGAFTRSLSAWKQAERMPPILWMHDPTAPIGIWTELREDQRGLRAIGQLAIETSGGREAFELLKLKAITGLSIGYRVVTSRLDSGRRTRVLTDVELYEISLVTFPANEAARVSSVKADPPEPTELTHWAARLRAAQESLLS